MREDDRGRAVPGNRPDLVRGSPPLVDPDRLRIAADREQARAGQLRGGVPAIEAGTFIQPPGAHYWPRGSPALPGQLQQVAAGHQPRGPGQAAASRPAQ